jgi:hypothetical protein
VCYVFVLEAKVVRVLVLKFGVLQILLHGTFTLQAQVLLATVLQLRVLGPKV